MRIRERSIIMNKTKFNKNLWQLNQFDEIGYDHEEQKLYVFYENGETIEFQHVEEKDVFELIISTDKEQLVNQTLKHTFPFTIHTGSAQFTV
jgi:hypothetical protein